MPWFGTYWPCMTNYTECRAVALTLVDLKYSWPGPLVLTMASAYTQGSWSPALTMASTCIQGSWSPALTMVSTSSKGHGHLPWPWLFVYCQGHGGWPWSWVLVTYQDHGQYLIHYFCLWEGSWSKLLNMLTMVKFLSCSDSSWAEWKGKFNLIVPVGK